MARHGNCVADNDIDIPSEDLNYTPNISEPRNYHKFLQLVHQGSLSDEEGSHGDLDGYIEDDIIGDMTVAEEDIDYIEADISDLTEADEHMYDNISSPEFETVPTTEGEASPNEPVNAVSEEEKQRELEKLKEELEKVEGEISTLRQVLGSKVRYASEIKRKMGITPFQELKQDLQTGIRTIKGSDTYQKTSSAMKTASEKTNAVVSSIGASVTRKLGDIRNSQTFKSMEEKVGGAYSNVKAKVTGSKSEGNFEDALQEEKAAGVNGDANTAEESLPESKVPL